MPQEILNEQYDHLNKVDIFSLGVAIYELIRGSSLPESGPQLLNIKEGKLTLLPGHSIPLQNLLKVPWYFFYLWSSSFPFQKLGRKFLESRVWLRLWISFLHMYFLFYQSIIEKHALVVICWICSFLFSTAGPDLAMWTQVCVFWLNIWKSILYDVEDVTLLLQVSVLKLQNFLLLAVVLVDVIQLISLTLLDKKILFTAKKKIRLAALWCWNSELLACVSMFFLLSLSGIIWQYAELIMSCEIIQLFLTVNSKSQVMVDPDPVRRPSAKDLVENPIFEKVLKIPRT